MCLTWLQHTILRNSWTWRLLHDCVHCRLFSWQQTSETPFQKHSKAMFLDNWRFPACVLSSCFFFCMEQSTWQSKIQSLLSLLWPMALFLFFNEKMSRMTPRRRVDSLEQLVHSTLAELVTIANEAGVPTGGKAWMWKFHWKYVSNRKTPWAFYFFIALWTFSERWVRSKHMFVCWVVLPQLWTVGIEV